LISLKKYLDFSTPPAKKGAAISEMLGIALESYRSSLRAGGDAVILASPGSKPSVELSRGLTEISNSFPEPTPDGIREVNTEVKAMLTKWGALTAGELRAAADETKGLLLILASTAATMGDRDHRYTTELGEFTFDLHNLANFEELKQIREALVEKAGELRSYIDQMAQDSLQMLGELRAKLAGYEAQLKDVEALAVRDSLTGLANRLGIERRITWHISANEGFCVLIVDLNRLKSVNDTYGHLAGDDMIRQFGHELEKHVRGVDLVGRWGGDEFVIILACDLAGARLHLGHLKQWMFGEYVIKTGRGNETVRVPITASMGLAPGRPGETMEQVLQEADAAMYREKVEEHKVATELALRR
jgi:diguanylate cyclase (GGDEF)-like protein